MSEPVAHRRPRRYVDEAEVKEQSGVVRGNTGYGTRRRAGSTVRCRYGKAGINRTIHSLD